MINKSNLKFYLIPVIIVITIIMVIIVITSRKPTTPFDSIDSIQDKSAQGKPTPTSSLPPTSTPTPTLIPPRFTGADISQELPPEVKLFSEQKTELRRKAPFDLSFGSISFDYENDIFLLTLAEPKDQSQIAFNAWREQTYPALPSEQFAIQ